MLPGWFYLFCAIVCEVAATTSMRASKGFKNLWYGILMLFFYVISFVFLNLSLKKIPLSVAYAIWSGVGVLLVAWIGVVYFSDKLTFIQFLFMLFIIAGVIGLTLTVKHH